MFSRFSTIIDNKPFTTNKFTGHDCVVYIVNPKNTNEALVAGYSCGKFGNYGNKTNKINLTPEILNIRESVLIQSNFKTTPYPVTSIGNSAFKDINPDLNPDIRLVKKIIIPSSIKIIGKEAFSRFQNLESIIFSGIKNKIILNNNPHNELIIFSGIKNKIKLNNNLHNKLKNWTFVEKEEGEEESKLDTIGERAFAECSNLKSIIIPKSVKIINKDAFVMCTSLESVTFEEESKLDTIGESAFGGCRNLKSIIIPKSVKIIDRDAFVMCTSLESVTFEEGSNLIVIRYGAFSNCKKLEKIIIPKSVREIKENAFLNCKLLKEVVFEKGSKFIIIDPKAFKGCDNIPDLPPRERLKTEDTIYSLNNNNFFSTVETKQSGGGKIINKRKTKQNKKNKSSKTKKVKK